MPIRSRPHACRAAVALRLLSGPAAILLPSAALAESVPPASPAVAEAPAAGRAVPVRTLKSVDVRADALPQGYAADGSNSATRLDLSLHETPQSVSVITRQQMDDLALDTIDDVLEHTTGIVVQQLDSERTSFYARGFPISNFQIDGVPQGLNAPLADTAIYERVDVVRGATGLLGGTGDPSATVNMIRKRPGRTLAASARVEAGRWNHHRVEGDVSVPLTADGRIRTRASGAWQEHDAFMRMYHERKNVGLATLEADLADRTLLTLSYDFQNNVPTGATWGAVPYWNADGSLAKLPRDFSLSTPWSTWRNRQHTLSGALQHVFANGWLLRLALARTTSVNDTTVAYAGSGYPDPATGAGMSLWSGVWGEGRYTNDNLDVYATGPFELFGREHTLVAGWNGWFQKYRSIGGSADLGYPAEVPDYRHWTGDIPRPVFVPDGSRSDQYTQLGGGYLAARFSLAEPLNAIVGVRVSNYRTWTRQYDTSGRLAGTGDRLAISDQVTPYAGVTWDLNPTYALYASYADLFQPQSYRDRDNRYLKPATGSNTEAGIKGSWNDGALDASLAVFRTRKVDVAERDTTVPPGFKLPDGSDAYVANGKGITVTGVEAQVAGNPVAGWNLSAGYTFLRAREADGTRAVPNQPRHLLRLSTAYQFGGSLEGLRVGAGVKLQSGIYEVSWYGRPPLHAEPYPHIRQGGYAVADAMAGYRFNAHLSAQLNVSNLFDRRYYRNVGFYDGVFWGEPRNVMLSLRVRM